jgi:two-component system, NarL family, invasion response regulator UvrY
MENHPMCMRVLVVDDNIFVNEGLRFMLTDAGMESVVATTCRGARQLAEQSNGDFDVVLLDIRLPDGDGLEMLAHLHAAWPDLPVLIYSYCDRPVYLARSHELGARGYLVKGKGNSSLLKAIQRVVAGDCVWTSAQLAVIAQTKSELDLPSASQGVSHDF